MLPISESIILLVILICVAFAFYMQHKGDETILLGQWQELLRRSDEAT